MGAWQRNLVACALVGLVGCSGSDKPPPRVGFPACVALLNDERLAGMRLVEASSYGSSADQCFFAPSNVRTSTASASNPIRGERVVVQHAGGKPTFGDVTFTSAPVDPGDTGPTAKR